MKKPIDQAELTSSYWFRISSSNLMPIGVALGFALIIVSIVIDVVYSGSSFSLSTLTSLYASNPIHWIISTSPIFLGLVFYILGRMVAIREEQLKAQATHEQKQVSCIEEFVSSLESGKLETKLSTHFSNKLLGEQLERFRSKLVVEKHEEEKRSWENEGLARFGELLRANKELDETSMEVLRFLVRYLKCNQGSLFVYEEQSPDGPALEMKACYAFDRKKYVNSRVPVGQGLIGQVYMEKETTLLFDVPQDFIKITSGLGTANPSCVVIVPMISNDEVSGVIEIASFQRLEKYQVNFLEKAANAFASVIRSSRVNLNVRSLLNESQQQMEELRAQEEEMRQNMEELTAIQEQLTRQLDENARVKQGMEEREKVLAQTTILSESDLFGTITFVNEKFCEVSQYSSQELIGQPHNFVRHPDMPKEIFKLMWTTIKRGETFRGIVKNRKKDGTHYWVDATIVPVIQDGKITKYIGARYHIKDDEMAERLYTRQLIQLGIGLKHVA